VTTLLSFVITAVDDVLSCDSEESTEEQFQPRPGSGILDVATLLIKGKCFEICQ
jgi:hypothetical protein